MGLLETFFIRHERNSLDRRIKKLLNKIETKNCSEDEFHAYLFDACDLIEYAREFNKEEISFIEKHAINALPVDKYESRLVLDEQIGPCYEEAELF